MGLRLRTRCAGIEQFGNAEIEQLDLPVRRHQHVARLEVAVHHQLLMRAGDCAAHFDEQFQSCFNIEASTSAIGLQRLAVDPLQHDAGASIGIDKRLDEFRNARIIQATQGALFVVRKTRVVQMVEPGPQYLEGDQPIIIQQTCFVDFTHATATEQGFDSITADRLTRPPAQPLGFDRRACQRERSGKTRITCQQRTGKLSQPFSISVVNRKIVEGPVAFRGIQLGQIGQVLLEPYPSCGFE